jgi:hypothetical protein
MPLSGQGVTGLRRQKKMMATIDPVSEAVKSRDLGEDIANSFTVGEAGGDRR